MDEFILNPEKLKRILDKEKNAPLGKAPNSAPQNSIAPIPVAASAAGPKCPTIATSTTLIKTRLRLLKIPGQANIKTSREIFLF